MTIEQDVQAKDKETTTATERMKAEWKEREKQLKEYSDNLESELERREKNTNISIADARAETQLLHAQVADLRSSLENLKADTKQRESDLLGEIARLKGELCEKRTEVDNCERCVSTESKENEYLRDAVTRLSLEIKELETGMQLAKEENVSINIEKQRLEEKLEDSYLQLAHQQGEITKAKLAGDTLRHQNDALNNALCDLKTESNTKEKEKELIEQKLKSMECEIKLADENLQMKTKHNAEIIKGCNSENESLAIEINKLKASVCVKEQEIQFVNELLERKKQRERNLEMHKCQLEKDAAINNEVSQNNEETIKKLSEKVVKLENQNKEYVKQHKENTDKLMVQFQDTLMERQRQQDQLETLLRKEVDAKEIQIVSLQKKLTATVEEKQEELEKREANWKELLQTREYVIEDIKRACEQKLMWKESEQQALKESYERALETKGIEMRDFQIFCTRNLEQKVKDFETSRKSTEETLLSKIKELEKMNEFLKNDFGARKSDLENLLGSAREEITSKETKLAEMIYTLRQKDAEIDELNKIREEALRGAEEFLTKKEQDISDLKMEIERASQLKKIEIEGLKALTAEELKGKETQLEFLRINEKKLKECLESVTIELENTRNESRKTIENKTSKIESLKKNYEEQLRLKDVQIQSLQRQRENSLETKERDNEILLKKSESLLRKRQDKIDEMHRKIEDITNSNACIVSEKENWIASLQESLKRSEEEKEAVENKLATTDEMSKQREKEFEELFEELMGEKKALIDEINNLTVALETVESNREDIEEQFKKCCSSFEGQLKECGMESQKRNNCLNDERKKNDLLANQLQLLRQEINAKEAVMKEMQQRLNDLKNKETSYQNQVSSLESEVRKKEEQLCDSRTSVQLLEQQKSYIEREEERLSNTIQEMSDKLLEYESVMEGLHLDNKELKEKAVEMHRKHMQVVEYVKAMEQMVKEKESEKENLEKRLRELAARSSEETEKEKRKYNEITGAMCKTNIRIEALENQLSNEENSVAEKSKEISRLEEQAQIFLGREEQLKIQLQTLSEELRLKNDQGNELKSIVRETKKDHERLLKELNDLKEASLNEEKSFKEQHCCLQRKYEEKILEAQNLHKEKESLVCDFQKTEEAQRNAETTIEKFIKSLKSDKEQLENRTQDLEKELKKKTQENIELKSISEDHNLQLSQLAQLRETLKASLVESERKFDETLKSAMNCEEEKRVLLWELKNAETQLERHLDEIKKCNQEIKNLKEQKHRERKQFEENLANRKKDIKQLQQQVKLLSEDKLHLCTEIHKRELNEREKVDACHSLEEKLRLYETENKILHRDSSKLKTVLKNVDVIMLKLRLREGKLHYFVRISFQKY